MRSVAVWPVIVAFVVVTSAGDVLMSKAMTLVGDVGELRKKHGVKGVVAAVASNRWFWAALAAMSLSFFTLLTALSWADLSMVGPASSALVFVSNTLAAKFYLREKVNARRWAASAVVGAGILLVNR